jgi:hypothetical protein
MSITPTNKNKPDLQERKSLDQLQSSRGFEDIPRELFIFIIQYSGPSGLKTFHTLRLVSRRLNALCLCPQVERAVARDQLAPFYKTRFPQEGYSTELHTKTVFFIRNTRKYENYAQWCNRHIEAKLGKAANNPNLKIRTLDDLAAQLNTMQARNKERILLSIWNGIISKPEIFYILSNPLCIYILKELGRLSNLLEEWISFDIGFLIFMQNNREEIFGSDWQSNLLESIHFEGCFRDSLYLSNLDLEALLSTLEVYSDFSKRLSRCSPEEGYPLYYPGELILFKFKLFARLEGWKALQSKDREIIANLIHQIDSILNINKIAFEDLSRCFQEAIEHKICSDPNWRKDLNASQIPDIVGKEASFWRNEVMALAVQSDLLAPQEQAYLKQMPNISLEPVINQIQEKLQTYLIERTAISHRFAM